MLIKLLKYEISATARQFLPLYGAIAVLAVLNKILLFSSGNLPELPGVISMTVYVALLAAIFVLTLIVMIQRFHKNLLSEEGYLMFTLPVKTWQLILSKLIVSVLWIFAGLAVLFLSMIIMMFDLSVLAHLRQNFPLLFEEFPALSFFGYSFEMFLISFFAIVSGILLIYASISLGHLFGRHRFLASFGAFLALNTCVSIVDDCVRKLFGAILFEGTSFQPALLFTLFGSMFLGALYFCITNYILSHKLNLE